MKKLLTLLLAMAMVFCLASCQYLPEGFQSAIDGAIDNVMGMLGGETTCEHDWIGATCTAPKTCSLCGATDGEANGHTEEIVAGKAATCTEAGMTDGKKCSVCGETTVEQSVIAALGHTEEIVAGTAATCTEAGMTDGKKCSVCGVTTVEQTAIEALDHKAGEDDGDVTTAVTCERCDFVFVEAKEAITLTIPTFENGAVVADKMNYAIGDTVKLTINPEFGYAQKLYINGEPLILDWNNNIYSFVAENDTYAIEGSFVQGLNLNPSDPARWETMNQAHGVISTQYSTNHNNESWWFDFNGDYSSISVKVKNYLPLEDSKDGEGKTGFSFILRISLDNGKFYAFRIINDKGTYAFDKFGASGSATGWGNWQALDSDAATALNGDGVDFKLARTGDDKLTLSVNGTVIFTYTMEGVTEDNNVTSVGLRHYGNVDTQVDIPFVLTTHTWVDATCTAPKTCSTCNMTVGEKLDHTYMNYVSNNDATCTEDGTKTGTCVCGEKNTIADEGSALGHKEETVVGKAPTCTETGLTDGKKCSVCGVTTVEQNEIPANGHKDDDGDYVCDTCGENLCTDHNEEIVTGKDATCTETGLTEGKKCSICGSVIIAQEVIPVLGHNASEDDGDCTTAVKCANAGCDYIFVEALSHNPEADDGDVTTAVKCANEGCKQILVPAKEAIALTIPTFENGAVTADKKNYAIGDTVTLTIAPAGGYFQKLYINGEPLMLGWKTFDYSFVAEKDTYVIDGSFEPTLEVYAGDWGRWDNNNQAHGVLAAYYPNNNDAWWFKIKGDYSSFAINAKNYREIANSYEGGPDGGWRIALYMQLDNGKYYAFSMWINADKVYAYNHFGGNIDGVASTTGWGGAWCLLSDKNAEATAALNGNGAEFKLERIDGNHIQITLGGKVLETYEIPGVTADNKVVSVGLLHYGNKGAHVEIPFALTVPTVEEEPSVPNDDVTLTIGEFANGTVTADKESYKIGDTVTLTIAPAGGYFQKLYINDEPLMLDWKTFTYSFTATENAYEITGSFENGLNLAPSDWGRWDDHNQAHGVLNTYYPNNNDSWWMAIKGNYNSLAINVQNQLPIGETAYNFFVYLRVTMENGNTYNFRIGTDKGGYTAYNRAGIKNPGDTSEDWSNWKNLSKFDSKITAEGVEFKVERQGANTLVLTVDGEVVDTYTMNGITAEDKIASIDIKHQGNKGKYVDISYEVK